MTVGRRAPHAGQQDRPDAYERRPKPGQIFNCKQPRHTQQARSRQWVASVGWQTRAGAAPGISPGQRLDCDSAANQSNPCSILAKPKLAARCLDARTLRKFYALCARSTPPEQTNHVLRQHPPLNPWQRFNRVSRSNQRAMVGSSFTATLCRCVNMASPAAPRSRVLIAATMCSCSAKEW